MFKTYNTKLFQKCNYNLNLDYKANIFTSELVKSSKSV